MREWFARFPTGSQARQDTYLLQPRLAGLSVKLRGGSALDVKSYLGSPGILGPAERGRLESWRKWSFPYDTKAPPDAANAPYAANAVSAYAANAVSAGWIAVSKKRSGIWFPLSASQDVAPAPRLTAQTGCAVELTEAEVRGEPWWTVGFEATGSASLLHTALRRAADQMFAQPLPPGIDFTLNNCCSYTQWLSQWPSLDLDSPNP